MILVLADSGLLTQSMKHFLSENNIDSIFHFPSISDAGAFGKGNVIVGKASYKSFERIVRKNNINCIIDIISVRQSKTSYTAIDVCSKLEIPIIKFVTPTLLLKRYVIDKYNVDCVVDYAYANIAERINNTVGNVLFLAKSYNVKAIADLVFDRGALYTPISAGFQFDVDLALEFGIPIMNVLAIDDNKNENVIEEIIRKIDAQILITDSSSEIFKKLNLASKLGMQIIFTQNTGIDFTNIVDDYESLLKFIEYENSKLKLNDDSSLDNSKVDDDINENFDVKVENNS